ncbi:hypothetical protein ACWPKO_05100 [Coraliomargarita sp. W4R53]
MTLVLGLTCKPDLASAIVRNYGYYFNLLLLVGVVLYSGRLLLSFCGHDLGTTGTSEHGHANLAKVTLIGLAAVLAGSTVVFHKLDLDYKILMDDYLLAATAKSMHTTGEVAVTEYGRNIDGEFVGLRSFVDKRPWFYPFLVSLAHDSLGYDVKNPFRVNALCAVALLVAVYTLGYWLAGQGGAILSVLLWASLPLLQQNATGGGMEMLNLLMLHLVLLLAIVYLRKPSFASEGALCLAGCILTYTRYESGLFLVPILCVVLFGWWRAQRVFLSWAAVFAAPLLLAVFLQTRIYAGTQSSWELGDGVVEPFSLSHLWANVPHAFAFFWSPDLAIANSLLLGVLALPALFAFGWVCYRQRNISWWRKPANQVWCLFSIFILLSLVVVLCFHAAQFDQRYVARYSLPSHMLIVFCTVSCLACLRTLRWVWGASIAIAVGFILLVTIPKNGQALYTKANFMIAEQHWLEALDASYMSEDTLIIDRFNIAWTLRERSALPPHAVWASGHEIEDGWQLGAYDEVFLVERSVVGSQGALQLTLPAVVGLKERYESELLAEKSFREGTLTRVYRLKL